MPFAGLPLRVNAYGVRDMGMGIRSALNWLAGVLAAVVVTPFLQTPFAKLAETTGFDQTVSDRWGPLMTWLSTLAENRWYIFFAGAVIGSAITLWLDVKLKTNDRDADRTPEFVRTVLRLQFTGEKEGPISQYEENIQDWYAYWSQSVEMKDANGTQIISVPSSWVLFVNFKQPTRYHQIVLLFSGGQPSAYEIRRTLVTSAIITINGPVPRCEMEMMLRAAPTII
jgi:hypothetical protein